MNKPLTDEQRETMRLMMSAMMMLSAKQIAKFLRKRNAFDLSRLEVFLGEALEDGGHRKSFAAIVQVILGEARLSRFVSSHMKGEKS